MVADFEDGNGLIPVADRYRVEVEFKAIDEAVLPWPILSDSILTSPVQLPLRFSR